MIAHALSIVKNELDLHLESYGVTSSNVELGNVGDLASGGSTPGVTRGNTVLSVVNVLEERTLKNVPSHVRDETAMRVRYENPPVFLNLAILVTATHTTYVDALLPLSRAILFFQSHTVFTNDTVDPSSLTTGAPLNALDRLDEFKLIFSLSTPTMEEVNHLWGTLGGKQLPFALYAMRMLELRFQAPQGESGLITDVVSSFAHAGSR